MKKRMLSVLLCGSLLFGTIGVNAVSIGFEDLKQNSSESSIYLEDLEQSDKTSDLEETQIPKAENIETVSENSILESNEDDSYIDEYYFPEATEENIQPLSLDDYNSIMPLSDDKYDNPETVIGFFTAADSSTYYNANSTGTDDDGLWGKAYYASYSNTSIDNSKYILFSNAVNANGKFYDLVLYPFKVGSKDAQIIYKTTKQGNIPAFLCNPANNIGCKFVITEHGNINHSVNMNVIIGSADLDKNEYIAFPTNFSILHQGSNVNKKSHSVIGYDKYVGTINVSGKTSYTKNCVFGKILIPTEGITVYYGSADYRGTLLSFDELIESSYIIQFNSNGGSSNIPSLMVKCGDDTSTIMGDIGSTVPTRSGYVFKGWSASSSWNSKRIAYTSDKGGSAAKDGTTATITSSSWNYATYCSNTGGNSSSNTLTLYAQWESVPQYSHTLAYNANGGTNAPSSSTVTNTLSTYSMTVSSSTPTRAGYTFAGWNTNSSGTGTNYSAGNSVSVGANSTVTLYAKWNPITYSITYNGNGNTGGSTASQTKTYNVAINLQSNDFTKTGYRFTGWNTASNGTGTSYSAGASYNSNANLTLYARWAINSSTLSVNPNGGSWNNSTVTQSFTQNYNTTKAIPIPIRTGYTFTKWNRSGTNGSMTSLTGGSTYTFGSSNGVTDTLTAEWKINNYTVTYIDVIDSKTGKELGRSTASKPYNSIVRGSDKGSSTTDNAYYNGYYYVSDTSATVTTSGATVYRIFKQRMNTIAGNIIWEDWNNKNLSRPENVNLYIKGSDGKTYSYVITGNYSQNTSVNRWPYSYELPKYDSNGNVIVYTVSQDRAVSQEKGLSYQEPLINGYDITNKITNMIINTEDYFQIPVTITWDDENDFYGFRPETATIQLLRNGEVIKTADVSDSYTFTELLKYDENGDKYVYTIQASDEKRYTKVENNSAPYNKTVTYTFVESSFSVLIPKVIVLDGNQGTANYDITVNGAFYYNDTLTVKPATSFVMTDRNNISSMKANILQSKQNFMKSDITSSGAKTIGSIQVDRTNFAGLWKGTFNFDIKFFMQN